MRAIVRFLQDVSYAPQHRLYFLPLPHGHGEFRPILREPEVVLFLPWSPTTFVMTLLPAPPLAPFLGPDALPFVAAEVTFGR